MKQQNVNVCKPWIKFYDEGVPETIKYPDKMLWEIIEDSANKFYNELAYEYYGTSVTFREFMEEIEEAACGLKSIGVKDGDVVTICSPNIPQAIISFYAVNMVGGIANMVHPLSALKEIENYLVVSKSKFVLTIDLAFEKILKVLDHTCIEKIVVMTVYEKMNMFAKTAYLLTQSKIKIPYEKDIVISWKQFLEFGYMYEGKCEVRKKCTSPAVILYSGGTTGNPKGVILSNKNFNAATLQTASMIQPVKPGESILSIMPIFHALGLNVCIHTPLSLGVKCILIPIFNYKKFGRLIKQYKPNYIVGVPSILETIINDLKLADMNLSFIKQIITGGDVITDSLKTRVDKFMKDRGSMATARAGYGLTEGSGASCLLPFKVQPKSSIGVPVQDMLYKIVDINTGDDLPFDTEGEILISGPNVMLGYLNDEDETKKVLIKDETGRIWLHTGDMGKMDKNGFVYFVQRIKRIVVSSGYNLYPSHVENVILNCDSVSSVCVIGISHPHKGKVLKAFIVLKDGIEPCDEIVNNIKHLCENYLAKYSVPYEYEFRDKLPMTKLGKVNFKVLEEEEIRNFS